MKGDRREFFRATFLRAAITPTFYTLLRFPTYKIEGKKLKFVVQTESYKRRRAITCPVSGSRPLAITGIFAGGSKDRNAVAR